MEIINASMFSGFIAGMIACFLVCNVLDVIQDFTQDFFSKIIDVSQNTPAYWKRVGYYLLLQILRVIFGIILGAFYFKVCQLLTLVIADKYNFTRDVVQFIVFFEYASRVILFLYTLQNVRKDLIYALWIVAGYLLGYLYFTC